MYTFALKKTDNEVMQETNMVEYYGFHYYLKYWSNLGSIVFYRHENQRGEIELHGANINDEDMKEFIDSDINQTINKYGNYIMGKLDICDTCHWRKVILPLETHDLVNIPRFVGKKICRGCVSNHYAQMAEWEERDKREKMLEELSVNYLKDVVNENMKLGEFNIESGVVAISDSQYDEKHNKNFMEVKNGKWEAWKAINKQCKRTRRNGEEITVKEVMSLTVKHSEYPLDIESIEWVDNDKKLGVDTASGGVYDKKYVAKYSKWLWKQLAKDEYDYKKPIEIGEHGVFISCGGDGDYKWQYAKVDDEVVAIKINFTENIWIAYYMAEEDYKRKESVLS